MKSKILISLVCFIFSISSVKSQNIEIGQDATLVKQFVEYSTKSHKRPDHFGNRASSYWTCDTKYYNGKITEVSQCYQNQFLYDFKISADYCKRFIMENNKLSYVLTQFKNISFSQLKQNYAEMYSENKINDFYFFDEFKHYSKIYLSKNGLATIEMRKTDISKLPKQVQQSLRSKLKELETTENNEATLNPNDLGTTSKQFVNSQKRNSIDTIERPIKYRYVFDAFSTTYKVSSKGDISVKVDGKNEVLVKSNSEYISINNVKYFTFKNYLLIELGNDSDEGYFYTVVVLNTKNNKLWEFDKTCSNWEDLFYVKSEHLFYACEYYCQNNQTYQLDVDDTSASAFPLDNCNFKDLNKLKIDFIPSITLSK